MEREPAGGACSWFCYYVLGLEVTGATSVVAGHSCCRIWDQALIKDRQAAARLLGAAHPPASAAFFSGVFTLLAI